MPCQRQSQSLGGGIGGGQRFGVQQVFPRGADIVLPQMPLSAIDVALGELLEESPRFAMAPDRWLAEQLLGLFKPPVLQGGSCLPECEPSHAEHCANPRKLGPFSSYIPLGSFA